MSQLGVPYPAMTKDEIEQKARDQAMEISEALVKAGAFLPEKSDMSEADLMRHLADTKVVALIAYLQKVGTYDTVDRERINQPLNPDSFRPDAKKKAPVAPETSSTR
jgi:cytochrome c oxidase cbb3-type subunit I/II